MNGPSIMIPADDWRDRIESLPVDIRARLAERAVVAPLFAHAYAFHLNLRFGGMTPLDLAKFAHAQGLAGIKLHVSDGEHASLNAMSPAELSVFGDLAKELNLEIHVETSTTTPAGLSDAVQRALAVEATSLRCYPLYEGRVSEIIAWTIDDLRRLDQFDPAEVNNLVDTLRVALAGTEGDVERLTPAAKVLAATMIYSEPALVKIMRNAAPMVSDGAWIGPSLRATKPQLLTAGVNLSDVITAVKPFADYTDGGRIIGERWKPALQKSLQSD